MRSLAIDDIRRALGGRWLAPADQAVATRVTTDSRDTRPGDLFIALRGERFDGHEFLASAAAGGCVAAIVDRSIDLPLEVATVFPGGLIGVADTTAALGELAAFSAMASDHEYLADGAVIEDQAALHLIPPVSGG